MINGKLITLVPTTLEDRQNVYDWCFQSETTKSHSGPPDYPENPIPTYEEFCTDDNGGYTEYYFTGEKPGDGRGFIIEFGGKAVGFISYCAFHLKPFISELDLWMNSEANCGRGFGTDALIVLGDYLHDAMGIRELIIAPSRKNTRAVRSYQKAGFVPTDKHMSEFLREKYVSLFGGGDYGEAGTLIMVRRFEAAGGSAGDDLPE